MSGSGKNPEILNRKPKWQKILGCGMEQNVREHASTFSLLTFLHFSIIFFYFITI